MSKKKNNFKTMGTGELEKSLREKREELRKLRFSAAGARSQNPSELGKLRKDIARIMTELSLQK